MKRQLFESQVLWRQAQGPELGVVLFTVWATVVTAPAVAQTAVAHSSGSVTLEILSPASLPSAFELNPGGTIPSNFEFPDGSNTGVGSFVA